MIINICIYLGIYVLYFLCEYIMLYFYFLYSRKFEKYYIKNKMYDEFWEGVILRIYCLVFGVLFVDVGLVVKEFWYDFDFIFFVGIY